MGNWKGQGLHYKRKMKMLDRISDLPDHIKNQILVRLSIRDAVRTSVLSTKWQNTWATLSSLEFDDQTFPFSSNEEESARAKELSTVIDHVLLLHLGSIQNFKLVNHRELLPVLNLDRWILYLSRHPVKELILKFPSSSFYKTPSCLFSCQNLTDLELSNCSVKPPSTFKGFMTLKSLHLCFVIMGQDEYEKLISSCPVLERLILWMSHNIYRCLNIDAPNLKFFKMGGHFSDVTLQNTLHLEEAYIFSEGLTGIRNLLNCFAKQQNLRRLEMDGNFIECLRRCGFPKDLPPLQTNVHYISVKLNFNNLKEIIVALCILNNAPNLQELCVRVSVQSIAEDKEESDTNIWRVDYKNCPYTQLRRVKIAPISGAKYEKHFIKHMLLNLPALERMTIVVAVKCCRNKWELAKDLLCFKRASAKSEIVLLDGKSDGARIYE